MTSDVAVRATVTRMQRVPVIEARRELARLLDEPSRMFAEADLAGWVRQLDFNARLVTALRVEQVPVFGRDAYVGEDAC